MSISFNGIGQKLVTFKSSGTVNAGEPVKLSANGTVAACTAGDAFAGIATCKASDGYIGVIIEGFVTLKYSGNTAPSVGWQCLCGDGSGGVAVDADEAGCDCLCVDVDTTGKTVTFMI